MVHSCMKTTIFNQPSRECACKIVFESEQYIILYITRYMNVCKNVIVSDLEDCCLANNFCRLLKYAFPVLNYNCKNNEQKEPK